MISYRTVSVIFVVLTVIFAASTGYLLASPTTVTQTTTLTLSQTATQIAGPSPFNVGIAFKPSIGSYLTNSSGWTLYLFTIDVPNNGTSACYGECAQFWPPFYASDLKLPPSLNASSFKVITRTDGIKQLTYNGWPLYYFAPDKRAGQTNGQGVGGVWYATSPATQPTTQIAGLPSYTLGLAYKSPVGLYLANASGWTLYLFTKDVPNNGTSACYGECAQFWPPFYISNLKVPPGLNASHFGMITRTDGSKQLTYNGYPLYYFASDKQAGDTNGQGVGGVWFAYSLPVPKIK